MRGSAAFRAAVAPGGALAGPWVKNELWRRARAVPSLDLRFAENKSLVDATTGSNLVTFTRASSGTFVGSDGVIRTAVTNLLLRSEEFDNAGWAKNNATVTANVAVSPNGTTTADKVASTLSAIDGNVLVVPTLLNSTPYTGSVYAKADAWGWVAIEIRSTASNILRAWFNVSSGVVGTVQSGMTATIQAVGNGWYRCAATRTSGTTNTDTRFRIFPTNADNVFSTGDGTSGLFLWGAQLEQSSTVGEYIPTTSTINSAPRFDHNPTTGESLGLLVEEQRTNSIRNNTMVGAVAGTPGTLPTNWSVAVAAGLTTNVIGTGTSQGVTYVDLQVTGTSNATSYVLAFDATTQIAASAGQSWSWSSWLAFVSGSLSGISTVSADFRESASGGTQLAAGTVGLSTLTSNLVRLSGTRVLSEATTAFVQPRLRLTITNGAAIDITLRIGLPQLEQGAFATSVIPTSTVAVTRSADVASISGSNFSSWYRQDEGTMFADYQPSKVVNATTWDISSATNENYNLRYASASQLQSAGSVGGVNQWNIAPAGYSTTGLRYKAALGIKVDDISQSAQGIITGSDNLASIPSANKIDIGQSRTGGDVGVLTIHRLTYWPTRLPNSTLQAVTQ
jgi:hypothetical protein